MVTELVFVAEFRGRCCLCLPVRDEKVERKERWKRSERTYGVFSFQKVGLMAFWLLSHLCGTRWQCLVQLTAPTTEKGKSYYGLWAPPESEKIGN